MADSASVGLQVEPYEPPRDPRPQAEPPIGLQPVEGTDDGFAAYVLHHASSLSMSALAALPEALLAPTLGALARLAKAVDRRHADAARSFLRQAFPGEPAERIERRVLQAYRHLLGVVIDGLRFNRRVLGPRVAERYTFELSADARRLVEQGPPFVLAGAHIGNWEAGAKGLELLGLGPLYVVSKPPKNRPMSIAMQRMREERGLRLLPRRGAMRFAAAIAAGGASLALLLDQRANLRPVIAPFFGRPARCDRSAGVLLRRLQVPVAIGACLRAEAPLHFRLVISAVLWPEELARADPAEIVGRINAELERMILAYPDQYFWLHDRYRDTPLAFEDGPAAISLTDSLG